MQIVVSDITNSFSLENLKTDIDAINQFVDKGNVFILATNKAMNYLAEDLSMINLNCEYYICNNGAVIFDQFFNVVYRKDIKQDLVRPIFNQLLNDDNMLEVYVDTSHGYVRDTSKSANGIVGRPYDIEKAKILLNKIENSYPEVHGHVDDSYLNIVDSSVTKASAVDYLINAYNYDVDKVIATGIGTNDLELIENYKGYTFENSIQDLKDKSIKTVKDIKELLELITPTSNPDEFDIEFEKQVEDYL